MLRDALKELALRGQELEKAANSLQCQKVEKMAYGIALALDVLYEIYKGFNEEQLEVERTNNVVQSISTVARGIELDVAEDDDDVILTDQEKELLKRRQETYQW